jgi:YHS domain-containing protein
MAQAIDPVCGMTVDTETTKFTTQYQGKTIYFCAPGCKKAFEQNPSSYLAHSSQGQEQQTTQSGNYPKESSARDE